MEFGYWGVKGAVEWIRWLAAYLGQPLNEWNPATPADWTARKATINPFPNLPFLIDGDFVLTESNAICQYLIQKSGKTDLLGKTFADQARLRQIDGVLMDIRISLYVNTFFISDDYKGNYGKAVEVGGVLADKMQQIANFLGDKEYFLGYLTWMDFLVAYFAQTSTALLYSLGVRSLVDPHKNIHALVKRITSLEGVSARCQSALTQPYLRLDLLPFPMKTQADIEAESSHQ